MTKTEYASVVLPWPSAELSPNSRNRWAKIKATKAARNLAAYELMAKGGISIPAKIAPLAVAFRFYPPTRRAFDLDNLVSRCKAYQDGLFDALQINDHQITQLTARREDVLKNGAVEIVISEAAHD